MWWVSPFHWLFVQTYLSTYQTGALNSHELCWKLDMWKLHIDKNGSFISTSEIISFLYIYTRKRSYFGLLYSFPLFLLQEGSWFWHLMKARLCFISHQPPLVYYPWTCLYSHSSLCYLQLTSKKYIVDFVPEDGESKLTLLETYNAR